MRRHAPSLLAFVLGTSAAWAIAAEEGQKAITDPAKAGQAYALQGEYAGTVRDPDQGERKLGIQVIALGNDRFEAVAYHGGLPGDGWDGEERVRGMGELKGGVARFTSDHGTGLIRDQKFVIADGDGAEIGALPKVERKSPTLGKKPPRNAVVLFDGKSLDQFEGGELTDGGYLSVLTARGVRSRKAFGDHHLHIEFRTPFMPEARGQARGNSGVYVQGRYEVQVLDSFGLEGKDNECGGIYQIAEPEVNMCYPPLAWQTYDVNFAAPRYEKGRKVRNARITIRHNGVLIHNDLELPRGTPGGTGDEAAEGGQLYLQNHGNPVVFRNIWVVEEPGGAEAN
jgi:hypothetical protein